MHLMTDLEKREARKRELAEAERRADEGLLTDDMRFENAMRIWIRDLRDDAMKRKAQGQRLTVAALGYEEVLKLREILGRFMRDRKRRIRGRWMRRRERRDARGVCLSCWQERSGKLTCTAGRKCVAAGRDSTRD